MTVADLIRALRSFPSDAEVVVDTPSGDLKITSTYSRSDVQLTIGIVVLTAES